MASQYSKLSLKCFLRLFYPFALFGIFLTILHSFIGLACASPPSSIEDKSHNFLNPQGIKPQVEVTPLAPRLKSIKGKTIFINMGESDKTQTPIMPNLFKLLKKKYPETDWRWIGAWGFGPNSPEDEVLKRAHGVIRGVAW